MMDDADEALDEISNPTVTYVVFDAATGQILQTKNGSLRTYGVGRRAGTDRLIIPEGVLDAGYDQTHYVDIAERAMLERPVISVLSTELTADGIDELSFAVPAETAVRVEGVDYGVVDDGAFVFAATMPAAYAIELLPPFPCCPLSVVVTANAP
jgi:hypothetical protein